MAPRVLVWSYFTALVMAAASTVAVLLALLLRFLPHDMLLSVGLACQTPEGCSTLLPGSTEAAVSFGLGGVLVGLFLFAMLAGWAQLVATRGRHLELVRQSRVWDGPCAGRARCLVLLIDEAAPVSYTIGFLRPRVVISTGLLATLDDQEIEAVLSHEEGHVAGRDNLVTLVAGTLTLTFAFVPGARRAFERLRHAQELAADGFARDRVGDGLIVASSLQKFARALIAPAPSPRLAAGFADEGNVTERIRGLLRDEVVLPSRRYVALGLICLGVVFTLFAGSAAAFSDVTVISDSECPVCHLASHQDDAVRVAAETGISPAFAPHGGRAPVWSTCAH